MISKFMYKHLIPLLECDWILKNYYFWTTWRVQVFFTKQLGHLHSINCWLQRVGIKFTSYKAFFVSNGSSNASILERFFFSKIDEANNNPIYFH